MKDDMLDGVALTDKQQIFVNEYLIDLNATKAAVRAGYSEKTAYSIGSENLRKPEIQKAIEKAFNERKARVLVTQDDVVNGLLDEAKNKDEGASHSARVSAWAHLGKHLGMFVDKTELSGSVHQEISNLTPEQVIERMKEKRNDY